MAVPLKPRSILTGEKDSGSKQVDAPSGGLIAGVVATPRVAQTLLDVRETSTGGCVEVDGENCRKFVEGCSKGRHKDIVGVNLKLLILCT